MLIDDVTLPTKEEQKAAKSAHDSLEVLLKTLHTEATDIEIEDSGQKIKLPLKALKLLSEILKETGRGATVSIIANDTYLTTQDAADLLGCSRPHLIKLVEKGNLPYSKVGKHRRIKYQDIIEYKRHLKVEQRRLLAELMQADEEAGLYDL